MSVFKPGSSNLELQSTEDSRHPPDLAPGDQQPHLAGNLPLFLEWEPMIGAIIIPLGHAQYILWSTDPDRGFFYCVGGKK